MTGGDPDDAAAGFLAIGDGPAERVGAGNRGIVLRTVVGDGEDGPGRGREVTHPARDQTNRGKNKILNARVS